GRHTKHNSPRRKVSIFTGKHSYLLQLKFFKFFPYILFTISLFPTISRVKPWIIWTNILPPRVTAIATIAFAITKENPKSLIMSVQTNF
ncbi:hypothetical protein FOPG_19263, partial [Fusarium oxysporum f. sp. conglutinans race 2 54008]